LCLLIFYGLGGVVADVKLYSYGRGLSAKVALRVKVHACSEYQIVDFVGWKLSRPEPKLGIVWERWL
jgi:hypothetical protein